MDIPKDCFVDSYFVQNSFYTANGGLCEKLSERAGLYVVSDNVFTSLSDTKTPQGILAVCVRPKPDIKKAAKHGGLYIILEEIRDPGNLGTIVRTANACGLDAVFTSSGSADLYSPKTLRSTMGAVFGVPVFEDIDIKETARMLKDLGVRVYAAELSGASSCYDEEYVKGTAFLIGNEANGLKAETLDIADSRIRIPMRPDAESLNASVASAVLMYEALRQRIASGGTL